MFLVVEFLQIMEKKLSLLLWLLFTSRSLQQYTYKCNAINNKSFFRTSDSCELFSFILFYCSSKNPLVKLDIFCKLFIKHISSVFRLTFFIFHNFTQRKNIENESCSRCNFKWSFIYLRFCLQTVLNSRNNYISFLEVAENKYLHLNFWCDATIEYPGILRYTWNVSWT